ncbi:50S ribosomal protein L4 [Talaromyces stipitatus ATCC 10500]|uniref:Large ribosomal subunit protein uL29m n=1 Tax=Talaromyces stipitatus (strain ATCC 10500 / CBS 375.48 / QM 6759 / NRRL 1006) TaxID=441959 RepID=B8M8V8_TALSN|nr:mitochondrial 54S ribosomal protein YmL4 [Talaromyces stipitatus ATCC 10500]EED20621.1 50S ribosomal protein L4 [Talaromyces stipitatus ATCC 10500]
MNRQSVVRLTRQLGTPLSAELPPPFLAPAVHGKFQSANFSSTASNAARHFPDKSKQRGVSAIHRTGPRYPLTVAKFPLPVPVTKENLPPRENNPNHGLWAFFPPDRMPMSTPEYDVAHGRSWSIQELRGKSWEDLHCLWWVCVKERNRIATSNMERERAKAGFGEAELIDRDRVVRATQRGIKHVLRERWYAWEDARQIWLKEAEEQWQTELQKERTAKAAKLEAKRQSRAEKKKKPETQPEA